ncbi:MULTISPECIES: excisionase family DNA-binding protein [unclassified Methylobacterium]|uniref:excisionase family DNA-binding protein n=1 Tax=unclassified Methylobacterium TaxID=2615210 RepID=UPI00226AD1BB|nr:MULTISPECIES: excisionase family DNA-binding protein [unclassified Methylobacterium]
MDRDLLEVLTKPTVDPVLAGRVLGVGRSASYRAVKDGSLPSFMVGAQYRIPTEHLLKQLGLDSPEARAAALRRIQG